IVDVLAKGPCRRRKVSRPDDLRGTELAEIGTLELIEVHGRPGLAGFRHHELDRRVGKCAVSNHKAYAEGAKKRRPESVEKDTCLSYIGLILRLGQELSSEIVHL